MTNNEVIIDGVDVSECENLMQGIVPFGCMEDRKTCSCMNNPNCLYKQLKHKEQECENNKIAYETELNSLQAQLKDTLEECEKLKRENEIITGMHNSLSNKFDKLYNTLQEIKKECHWVSECGVTNDNMWGYDNILDLITKEEEE